MGEYISAQEWYPKHRRYYQSTNGPLDCPQCGDEDLAARREIRERQERDLGVAGTWVCPNYYGNRHPGETRIYGTQSLPDGVLDQPERFARRSEYCHSCGMRNPALPAQQKHCVRCKKTGQGSYCESCGGELR